MKRLALYRWIALAKGAGLVVLLFGLSLLSLSLLGRFKVLPLLWLADLIPVSIFLLGAGLIGWGAWLLRQSEVQRTRLELFDAGQREILERTATGAPLSELLERTVRLVEGQAEGLICSILLLDQDQKRLRRGAAPNLPEEYNRLVDGLPIGPDVGSCGAAAWRGERVIVEDIATHRNWATGRELALRHGLRACWSTPILSPTREVLGTFAIYHRETRGPLPEEISWIDAATQLTAIALNRDAVERALRQSETRYRQMMNTAYEGIFVVDLDYRVTFANHRLAEMLGCEPAEIVGRSMLDFMSEAGRAEIKVHRAKREKGLSEQFEFLFVRQDGTELWTIVASSPIFDDQGRLVNVLSMITDITERKSVEAALRRSEAEFRAIFENAAIGITQVQMDGRFTNVNPAFARLLGYTREELTQMAIPDITLPDEIKGSLNLFHDLTHGRCDLYQIEKRYQRKDGGMVWALLTVSAVRENDGALRFAIGMVEDSTKRKQAEEEHGKLEAQLRQSQKMQSLGTLAGGIAHDFNNLLTAILGNTSLALPTLPPDHPAYLSLQEIERASERAADLVRQILAFSRPQEPKRRTVSLRLVVEEALQLLRVSLPATVEIQTGLADETPDVAADSSQLHQVVVNLCTNAVQAMGERTGLLELRLAPFLVDAACARAIPGLREGPHVRLTICDNGCGMDQATLERIFEPFFTTKTVGKGTGLGLSVVHTIVRNHGGAITAYSRPDQGSTFHLYFPAAQASVPAATIAVPSSIARGHGERVLYVDDEEQLVFLAQRKLQQLGYQVTGCTEPIEALEIFIARPAEFDLVVTDLTMPRMTGLIFGAEIRRVRRDIPIILTSGFLRREDMEAAERLGIYDFIPKPSDPETFSRTLRTALSRDGKATRF